MPQKCPKTQEKTLTSSTNVDMTRFFNVLFNHLLIYIKINQAMN